ncbi:MAG TPA: hypothetical protein VE242_06905, partial [Chthoniobacterales bacterium]|nr:hypothetical protein [Chthoniobacterales bacterium]
RVAVCPLSQLVIRNSIQPFPLRRPLVCPNFVALCLPHFTMRSLAPFFVGMLLAGSLWAEEKFSINRPS